MIRRNTLRRSGAELLELGLVLGVILLPIMFGTVEFGTYFYVEHNLQSAAREGARAACVFASIDDERDAAEAAVNAVLTQSSLSKWDGFMDDLQVDISQIPDPTDNTRNYCTVSVSITWDKIPAGMRPMKMIRNPQNSELKGYAAMRVEQLTP